MPDIKEISHSFSSSNLLKKPRCKNYGFKPSQPTLRKSLFFNYFKVCLKEARASIEKLEFLLREATRQRQRDVVQAADNTALLLKETQDKMEQMKQDLIEERSQTVQYRDLLAQVRHITKILLVPVLRPIVFVMQPIGKPIVFCAYFVDLVLKIY